jgi:D-glycero-D-manno-heptose 1,7-bisphosphate phosphatase
MIPLTVGKDDPLSCECGRKYHFDRAEERFVCSPGVVLPALCLDLDGTVRYSASGEFVNHPDDVRLFDDVEEKIWEYREERGFLILGISNQAGVAHGFKTQLSNDAEIKRTLELFERNPFHIVKCCYHHPSGKVEPYNHRSLLRKPDIGMLAVCEVEAFEEGYIIDWDKSIFVGDRPEDAVCAHNAGIQFASADEFFGRRGQT